MKRFIYIISCILMFLAYPLRPIADTVENRAIVQFYLNDEDNNKRNENPQVMPKTGSTHSNLLIVCGWVIFVVTVIKIDRKYEGNKLSK